MDVQTVAARLVSADQAESKTRRKQSGNDGGSQKSEALMRLRQRFTWRHINSDSRRLLFGLGADGGTELWPAVHPPRRYWATSV